jgi:taurine dioxygenase
MRVTRGFAIPRRTVEVHAYRTIAVEPLTPTIGAEVSGVDLSQPLDAVQQAEIHAAFLRHLVLFFRDQQPLTAGAQIRFGRLFGPLHVHPAAPQVEGHPEVMVVRTDKDSKTNNGEDWHSDVSCDVEPPLGSILQVRVLPSFGGDTLFASMYAAYDDLSPAAKALLGGLVAVHESEHFYRGRYGEETTKPYPSAEHPVIRTHPETGRQAIFVNRIFTTRLRGLEPAESRALLEFLFAHVENPYYQVRFRWRENDVAFWDNRCAQHIALWDYWPHERSGYRVAIRGDRPFYRP